MLAPDAIAKDLGAHEGARSAINGRIAVKPSRPLGFDRMSPAPESWWKIASPPG